MFTQHIECKSLYDKSSILISNVNELCNKYQKVKQLKMEYENSQREINKLCKNNRNLNDISNEYDNLSAENNNKN